MPFDPLAATRNTRIGLGLAALGRPAYINLGRESDLPAERPLDIRETPEFLKLAARVRDGLRAGHSYEE